MPNPLKTLIVLALLALSGPGCRHDLTRTGGDAAAGDSAALDSSGDSHLDVSVIADQGTAEDPISLDLLVQDQGTDPDQHKIQDLKPAQDQLKIPDLKPGLDQHKILDLKSAPDQLKVSDLKPGPDKTPAPDLWIAPDKTVVDAGPKCGDGKVSPGEECDGNSMAGKSCKTEGYPAGTLKCTKNCKLDISGCYGVLGSCGLALAKSGSHDYHSAVGFDGTNYLVVWQRSVSYYNSRIYGVRVSQQGKVLDNPPLAIDTTAIQQSYPRLAFDGTNYLVVWQTYRPINKGQFEVVARRVSPAGVVLDTTQIKLSRDSGAALNAAVAFDGSSFLAAWVFLGKGSPTGYDIHGVQVTPSGGLKGNKDLIISAAAASQKLPAVACGSSNCLVAWEDYRSSSYSVYSTRVSPGGGNPGSCRDRRDECQTYALQHFEWRLFAHRGLGRRDLSGRLAGQIIQPLRHQGGQGKRGQPVDGFQGNHPVRKQRLQLPPQGFLPAAELSGRLVQQLLRHPGGGREQRGDHHHRHLGPERLRWIQHLAVPRPGLRAHLLPV